MAIQYVGGQTSSIPAGAIVGATITFNLDGGLAITPSAGDLVVVLYGTGSSADRAIGVTSAGYTEIAELYSADMYDTNMSVSWKIMGSTPDTSVTVGPTGSTNDGGVVIIQVYRGVDKTTPFDVTSTTATGTNSGWANPPAITPITTGAIILVAGAAGYIGASFGTFVASYLSSFRTTSRTTDGYDSTAGMGYVAWTSGAYDPAVWISSSVTDSTSNSWCAVTMALRPAAATYVDGALADTATATTTPSGAITAAGAAAATPAATTTATAQIIQQAVAAASAAATTVAAGTATLVASFADTAQATTAASAERIRTAAIADTVTSTTTLSGAVIRGASAAVSASTGTTASGGVEVDASAAATVTSGTTASGGLSITAASIAEITATVIAAAQTVADGVGAMVAGSGATASAAKITAAGAIALGSCIIRAAGRLLWEPKSVDASAWAAIGTDPATWGDTEAGTTTWADSEADAGIWTPRDPAPGWGT